MQIDLFDKPRFKVNLHTHTSLSDGQRTPAEVAQRYRAEGYDAIALTDHWFFGDGEETDSFTILSGAEYNIGGNDTRDGVYHIVAVGAKRPPSVAKDMPVQKIIDAVRKAGGLAILAHPAWSLNTPEEIMQLKNIDATEIYNSASGVHMSRRADSSLIVDVLASRGMILPLLATDDAHYYDNDACVSWIMVEAADNTREYLLPAIRAGKFYATQGPEIHLLREDDGLTVKCSPCREIIFHSNYAWSKRIFTGDALTEAHYKPREKECYIRAEVVDADGKRAWSNIIPIE